MWWCVLHTVSICGVCLHFGVCLSYHQMFFCFSFSYWSVSLLKVSCLILSVCVLVNFCTKQWNIKFLAMHLRFHLPPSHGHCSNDDQFSIYFLPCEIWETFWSVDYHPLWSILCTFSVYYLYIISTFSVYYLYIISHDILMLPWHELDWNVCFSPHPT